MILRAVSLDVGIQNAGLGTTLAVTLFGAGSGPTIPTASYTFGFMLTGTVLATWWRIRPGDPAASYLTPLTHQSVDKRLGVIRQGV